MSYTSHVAAQSFPRWVPDPSRMVSDRPCCGEPIFLPAKYPSDSLDYSMDWVAWSASDIVVLGAVVTVEPGSRIRVLEQFLTPASVQTAILAGGCPGNWRVRFEAFLSSGRREVVETTLIVLDQYAYVVEPVVNDQGAVLVTQRGEPLY